MTAGPARLMEKPIHRNRPVPIVPPNAIIDSLPAFSVRCSPDSRSASEENVSSKLFNRTPHDRLRSATTVRRRLASGLELSDGERGSEPAVTEDSCTLRQGEVRRTCMPTDTSADSGSVEPLPTLVARLVQSINELRRQGTPAAVLAPAADAADTIDHRASGSSNEEEIRAARMAV